METFIIPIFSSFLGYIIIFLTLKSSKHNRILNSFLMFVIFISSTLLLIAGIGGLFNNAFFKILYLKCAIYVILLIPCFYIYFTYLIKDQQRFQYKDFSHILFVLAAILEREFLVLDKLLGFTLNYFFSQFFAIYTLVYLAKIYLILQKNVWNRKATLSVVMAQNKLIKKWSVLLFSVLTFFILRFHITYYKQFLFLETVAIDQPLKYIWITALGWIGLFLTMLSYPEILYGFNKFQSQPSTINPEVYDNNYWNLISKIKINNNHDIVLKEKIGTNIEKYIFELNVVLYNNSYFVNPSFSMKDLAQVLNIPKSHLTFVFKYHTELSFSDYKNISRIQNSLELINTNYLTSNTLDALARKVGFSGYTTFFNCFKDVVGKSPHEYVSTVKNVLA